MNTTHLKKLQMAITLLAFLKENSAIMQNIPNSAALIAELEEVIQLIQQDDLQQMDTTYLTERKNELRAVLNEQMKFVSKRMVVFAEDVNDQKLMSLVKYTPSEIDKYKDGEISQESASLLDQVNHFLSQLAAYGLNADTQKTFTEARTNFVNVIPDNKREAQSQKDVRNQLLADFDHLDELLGKLDKRVDMLSTDYPVFYTDYYGLRKVSVPKSAQALLAQANDAVSGIALPNVEVTFILNGVVKLKKFTAEQGGFRVPNLEQGIYEIEAIKIGYETLKQSITITGDATYYLNLKMKKL